MFSIFLFFSLLTSPLSPLCSPCDISALSSHPNVVKLLGYTENPYCLITPLYQGDLHTLISLRQKHQYTSLDAADILYHMVSGVQAVHAIGVAHRDIKPKNFLLEPRPDHQPSSTPGEWSSFPYRVRICDFGVCYVDPNKSKTLLRLLNIFGVSIRYAPPEVFTTFAFNISAVSLQDFQLADMYSLGISLWELLHRVEPWKGRSAEEIQNVVVKDERPPLSLDPARDPKLVYFLKVVATCWQQDPSARSSLMEILGHFSALYLQTPLK